MLPASGAVRRRELPWAKRGSGEAGERQGRRREPSWGAGVGQGRGRERYVEGSGCREERQQGWEDLRQGRQKGANCGSQKEIEKSVRGIELFKKKKKTELVVAGLERHQNQRKCKKSQEVKLQMPRLFRTHSQGAHGQPQRQGTTSSVPCEPQLIPTT